MKMVKAKEFTKLIIIPSRIREIGQVVEAFKAYFNQKSYQGIKYRRLLDAIYEALSNAIIHGNKKDETKKISITWVDRSDKFQVKVTDEGEGFDTHSIPDPCLPHNITKSHGRGLYIIKNSVDELNFDEDGNEITMVIHK